MNKLCPRCQRELEEDSCPCGWPDEWDKSPVPSRIRVAPVKGITQEEFGLNAVIQTIGGLLGLEQQRATAIHQGTGYKVQGLLARRKDLQAILAKQLPLLTEQELSQVLAKYPWVAQC